MNNFIVAIDGTAASGKGTISKKLAEYFNFRYLDTGLSYRAIAYYILQNNIIIDDEQNILKLAQNLNFNKLNELNLQNNELGNVASKIAVIAKLREILVTKQRNFANETSSGVILDGRDIGTVVYPEANVKFYIDANIKTRAERRYAMLKELTPDIKKTDILQQLIERDTRDKERKIGALTKAIDAYLIDTTELTIEESFEKTKNIIKLSFK